MKVITKIVQLSFFLFFLSTVNAQIKIGDNPTVINPSAILEIESASEGFFQLCFSFFENPRNLNTANNKTVPNIIL